MKRKKSDTSVTAVSYLISMAFHALLLLVSALLVGHIAGKAEGMPENKSAPIDIIFVAAAPAPTLETEEAASEPESVQPVAESPVKVAELKPEEKKAVVAEPKTEPKPVKEASGKETDTGEKASSKAGPGKEPSRTEEVGEGGTAPNGQGMADSPFPTGTFGVFDVHCSKTDENRGITGDSVFEVVFKDGRLDVSPIADSVVGEIATIKIAIGKIMTSFRPDALPAEPGGVFRGKIACRYARCETNECRVIP